MPGVPPDALSNVKKGLKSIFSRRKKDKHQQMSGSQGSGAAMGDASNQQTATPMPQISEPATTAESKNIDLNPDANDTSAGAAKATTSGMPDTVTNPQAQAEQSTMEMGKLDAKLPAEGMSATSGPLSDDLGAMAVSEEKGLGMGGEETTGGMKKDMAGDMAAAAKVEGMGEGTGMGMKSEDAGMGTAAAAENGGMKTETAA